MKIKRIEVIKTIERELTEMDNHELAWLYKELYIRRLKRLIQQKPDDIKLLRKELTQAKLMLIAVGDYFIDEGDNGQRN